MRDCSLPAKLSPLSSRVAAVLLLSLLGLLAHAGAPSSGLAPPQLALDAAQLSVPPPADADQYHDFTLRHIFHHGTYRFPQLHKRLDTLPEDTTSPQALTSTHFRARSHSTRIHRLADRQPATIELHLARARNSRAGVSAAASAWTVDEVPGPNATDKNTILSLARASADAYKETPDETGWRDVGGGFNLSQSFGWQQDGLRGHIFADQDNTTILMALKGTTAAVFDGEGSTTNDKVNDNLFFSCCCAQGGHYFWRQVCDCSSTTFTCNQTCLVKALKDENRYYRAAIDLYSNVTELYPNSDVWLTGHSLGGAVSSFLGMTFGIPTITFESPPDALAAARLGLPAPPGSDPDRPTIRRDTGVHHFGHTADPVFMGSCSGVTDSCTLGGYAFETQCHTGVRCVYDTVTDSGWSVGIINHKIDTVIDSVLEKYENTPKCVPDDECVDCYNWKYFESNSSSPTVSTSTTTMKTRTRTATCQTPGWWGCLDTTTGMPSSSSLSTTSTSTCKTPGWFWCNDPTTTTTSSPTASPVASPAPSITTTLTTPTSASSSCQDPGWFGCRDSTSSTSRAGQTGSSHDDAVPKRSSSQHDRQTTEIANPVTSPASLPSTTYTETLPSTSSTCTHEFFFGLFCLDSVSIESSATLRHTRHTTMSRGLGSSEDDWRDEM